MSGMTTAPSSGPLGRPESHRFDGQAYQARFDALAAGGINVHGEAALVLALGPATVLDAGCGTGRVAIELARHGIEVVGVDLDLSMVAEARRRAPEMEWVCADMSVTDLERHFDIVVLAGNVPLFCPVESRAALIGACAGHVDEGGALVAGFQLGNGYLLDDYDSACAASGLAIEQRWSTWDREPFRTSSSYAVSVHRRPVENGLPNPKI